MRLVPIVAVLAQSAVAVAQPCEVTIARAPDAVRIEIETWVRAEPRCSTALEVRVIPTIASAGGAGGYYLFARDPAGRVRERFVPDAQSAGVLVASWVADDSMPILIAPPPSIEILAPVIVGPGDAPVITRMARAADRGSRRWLTLGAMTQMGGTGAYGVRGELDLFARGAWSIGTTVSGSASNLPLFTFSGSGYMEVKDLRINASIARTSNFGKWSLRISGGLGAVHSSVRGTITEAFGPGDPAESSFTTYGWFWSGEVAALFGRRFGSWGVAAGPVVTFYSQSFDVFQDNMVTPVSRADSELMAFGAIRHEL